MSVELKLPQKHTHCIKITSDLVLTRQNMVHIEIDSWSSGPNITLNRSKTVFTEEGANESKMPNVCTMCITNTHAHCTLKGIN